MTSNALVIALDLEGTLISHASTMIPRPGLLEFLTFCKDNAERVVFLSFVDEEKGRTILNRMADAGHMPDWVRTAEYFHAQGGRPGAKNLRQLGVEPEQVLLVDDQPQVLPSEQQHRLVRVVEFKEPFSAADSELEQVQKRIMEKQHSIQVCGADEVDRFSANRLTHLITIANPGVVKQPPGWFIGDHLALSFGDVVSEKDARQCNTKAANSDDIRQAIVFFRAARKQQEPVSLLITCDYGASRSPALAYVLLADQYGGGYESDALNTLLAIRPVAVPNLLVATFGDQLLRRNGALLTPLKEYFSRLIVQT